MTPRRMPALFMLNFTAATNSAHNSLLWKPCPTPRNGTRLPTAYSARRPHKWPSAAWRKAGSVLRLSAPVLRSRDCGGWTIGGYSSMVEPQIVVLDVAGSNPVGHPIFPPPLFSQFG